MKKKIIILTFFIVVAISRTVFAQGSGYHVQNTFHIYSPGGWDYIAVSPVTDNIYVSHSAQVNILNKKTGDSTGMIPNTTGVHGIAFAPAFKKGFTSNGKINTVTVFDIHSNAVLDQIKTGENPDAIMYDPFSKKVYVCDGHSKTLTVIDPANDEVVKTVELGGKPETAVSDDAGRIYIDIEDKSEIAVVNAKTYIVENRWKIGKGEEPTGLAIDTKTKRLFAGCGNKLLIVLSSEDGKIVKELPIGEGCDGVVFDPVLKCAFSANGRDGTLTVIREKSGNDITVIDNVPTKKGARTIAIDPKTHKVYLPTADFGAKVPGEKRPPIIAGSFEVLVAGKN